MRRLGMIALVAGAISAAGAPALAGGGGCHLPEKTTATAADTDSMIVIHGGCVYPSILTVAAGREITWHNKDEFPHTITSGVGEWAESEVSGANPRFSYMFSEPGLYAWYCRYHVNMGGVVSVGDVMAPADEVQTAPVADASSAPSTSVPLMVIPAIAAAGIGFVTGRRSNGSAVR